MPLSNFLGVFAKSPIKPLEEHINRVHTCCEALNPFFSAVIAEDWEQAANLQQTISRLEKEADQLKHQIRQHLPAGLFMPVERTDMLSLLKQQDKMANTAKDIAGRIVGRKMVFPEVLHADLLPYVRRCVDAVAQARSAINELDDLLESGFGGREINLVGKMVDELDRIEDDTDVMQRKLRLQLFEVEKDLNPIDAIFLYQILEWLGDLGNRADKAGSQLEQMLTRS